MLPRIIVSGLLYATATISSQATLIGDWRMDEGGGSLIDLTGNHVAGTTTGSVFYGQTGVSDGLYDAPSGGASISISGAAGTSINFGPAPNEFFTIGTSNVTAVQNIDRAGAFTVMGWIKLDNLLNNHAYRMLSTGGSSGGDGGWGFGLRNSGGNGTLRFTTYNVADNDSATFTLSTGTWYHIAATYNNGAIDYYLDGELLAGSDNSLFYNDGANARLTIGNRLGSASDDLMDGSLDGVRVYDAVLSATEIQGAAVASVTAVPEPSVALLGGVGLLGLLRRRRG